MLFLIYFWCIILEIYENNSLISNSTIFSINNDDRNYKTINDLALDLERSEEARVKESQKCTQEDIRDSVQCFQTVPNSSYVGEINQTVEMPCVVLNQHGKVQWRANSALLGYDRVIPGRPRYRIIGDPSKGEHILQIKNINIDDDGKYECQVQPIGIKHPQLRRITNLSVIVLPETPQLYFRGRHLSNKIIELSLKDQYKYIEIKCISRKGRPNVSFNWFVNGNPVCDTSENCDIQSLSSSVSKLRFLPNNMKTIRNISCVVVNSATMRYSKFQNNQTLNVIIQTPPNIPEIQSFTNEKIIEISENDSLKLFCHCTPPGFPVASLFWEWHWLSESSNDTQLKIDKRYFTISYNKMSTVSSLHLFSIPRNFHSGFIHCIANHPTGLVNSLGVQIMIKYPPKLINIKINNSFLQNIYDMKHYILLDENIGQKISCITSDYYGSVNLKWKMDVEDLGVGKNLRSIEKLWQIGSSYKQQSSITITLSPTINEIKLNCVLFFAEKLILKSSVTIMKIKKAEKVYVENYQSTYVFEENQILRLKCWSTGGLPMPELVWLLNGETIVKSKNQDVATNNNSVILELKIQRVHNTASLKCQTLLRHFQTKPVSSKPIKITVVFAPLKIKIENNFPKNLLENENIVFSCITTESNPPTGLIWKIKICKSVNTEICTEDILSDVKEYIFAGTKFHGYKTKSILKLSMLWKYHLEYLICETLFSYSQNTYPIIRSQIQLFISFKPNFINIGNFSQILLTLGSLNQSIIIETVANPLPINYKWYFKSFSPFISTIGSTISFQKIDQSIVQEYKLLASNALGKSLLIFNVDVTYSPKIIGEKYIKYQIYSKITELECLVESNPPPQYSYINWIFLSSYNEFNDNFNDTQHTKYSCNQGHWKSKLLKVFVKCRLINPKMISSSLIIYNTSPDDVGTYICSASDNKSLSENKTIELITLSIPHFIAIPLFSKVAILSNSKSQARTLMYSGLLSNLSLHVHLHLNKTAKFPSYMKRINSGTYLATSEFNIAPLDDIEKIYWKAENKLGSSTLMIEAVSESVPDAPILQETKVLHTNVLSIKITQAFDGGYPQTFQIFWKEAYKNNSSNKLWEVPGDYTKRFLVMKVSDTFSNKNYEIQICSKNQIHGRSRICPTKILYLDGKQSIESSSEETTDNLYELLFQFNLKIVIAVAGFVFGLILLAIFIIVFLFKRKRNQSIPDLRSNINLDYKYGNDLLITNLSIAESKSDFHTITSLDKSLIPLNQITSHYSQSKV